MLKSSRIRLQVYPGSMGVCFTLIRIWGSENVDPGSWGTPCNVLLSEDDLETGISLIKEEHPEVKFRMQAEEDPLHIWKELEV